MSDSDFEDSQCPGWLDLESCLPHHSLVDSADNSTLGVNVSTEPFSANQTQARALVIRDSNRSCPASTTGISVGYAPPRGTGPDEGEEFLFLESPTQTTLQSKTPSILPFHCGRPIGRGREMGGGRKTLQ